MQFMSTVMMVLSAFFIVVGLKNFISASKNKNQKIKKKALLFMLLGVALLAISVLDSMLFAA